MAITANWFNRDSENWRDLFDNQLAKYGSVTFSAGIKGKAYTKHGTNIETRLTVFDKVPKQPDGIIVNDCLNLTDLLKQLQLPCS